MTKHPSCERGVGLIEVLVTLLILSTTLIALSSLQTRSLQFNQGAYFRTQANMLAYDMLDRIRANEALSDKVASKEPLTAFTMAEAETATAASSPASAVDKYEWMTAVNAVLPGAKGKITCDGATFICNIEISWKELNASDQESEGSSKFVFEARI